MDKADVIILSISFSFDKKGKKSVFKILVRMWYAVSSGIFAGTGTPSSFNIQSRGSLFIAAAPLPFFVILLSIAPFVTDLKMIH